MARFVGEASAKQFKIRIFKAAGLLCFLAATDSGYAASLPVGVQRTDLAWHADGDSAAAKAIIADIAQAGPAFVRINVRVRDHFEVVAGHIRAAQEQNLHVLLELAHFTDPAIYPAGTEKRPGRESLWPSFPASQADPVAFESWLDDLFAILKRDNAIPQLVQTGNELNWCGFNGDFPILREGEGEAYSDASWEDLPEAVRNGARKAGLIAAITARKMREWFPDDSERPKVILSSLNKPADPEWLARSGGTFLLPEIFLEIASGSLEEMPPEETQNYLKELDGISLHFYPPVGNRTGSALSSSFRAYLSEFMDPVRKVTSLPVYITEFGFPRSEFPTEHERAEALAEFVDQMDRQRSRYNFAAVAIFSWDQLDYALVDPGTGELDPAFAEELGWSPR